MQPLSDSLSSKFTGLLAYLKQSGSDFQIIADEIGPSSLRTALNNLADESLCFAIEIKNYLSSFGLPTLFSQEEIPAVPEYPSFVSSSAGTELMLICNANEASISGAYAALLDEQLPSRSLQEIMLSQMKSLQFTFSKIKLLNNARFTPRS